MPTAMDEEKIEITSPHSINAEDTKDIEKDVISAAHPGEEIVTTRNELGAVKVEATLRVWGKYSKWALWVSLALAAYIYSLDGSTTWFYLQFATSAFDQHGLLSSVSVAQQVIVAVGKPVIARVADLQSRPFALIVVLLFYVVGYIINASSKNVASIAGGQIFYSMGYTGLQLLVTIIIADLTSLRHRALFTSLISLPYIINAFVGSKIAARIVGDDTANGWRWGYGMFSIMVPVVLLPLIISLLWGERKAKKIELVPKTENEVVKIDERPPIAKRILGYLLDMDLLGLMLLGVGLALLLIPITLSQKAVGGWNNKSIIAMITLGPIFLMVFTIYEIWFAPNPVLPKFLMSNVGVMTCAFIGFFDFVSFYLTFIYTSSFIYVVKTDWSLDDQGYFGNIQTVGLTLFAILCSILMYYWRRYKALLIASLAIRLFGVGLMIHSRGAQGTDAELVMTQIIQSFGGGITVIIIQTVSQASVIHKHVAIVTAVVLLITEIGGAIGTAVAGGIWDNMMPQRLAHHLPEVPQEIRDQLFGATTAITALDPDDPVRIGVIAAYGDTMEVLLIVATVLSVPPLILGFLVPDYRLGDAQNAIDGLNAAGEKVEESQDKKLQATQ